MNVEVCHNYEDRVRTVGLTTLETRILSADMIEVDTFSRGFEGTEEVTFFQRRVGATKGHDRNCSRILNFVSAIKNLVSAIAFVMVGTGCRGGLSTCHAVGKV